MRLVATRLSNQLVKVPKYGPLPNSDYNSHQKIDSVIHLTLDSSKKGKLGDLHIRVPEPPNAALREYCTQDCRKLQANVTRICCIQ
jgi:hypothetical protein